MDTPKEDIEARMERLERTVIIQRALIDKLHAAVLGHQVILEAVQGYIESSERQKPISLSTLN